MGDPTTKQYGNPQWNPSEKKSDDKLNTNPNGLKRNGTTEENKVEDDDQKQMETNGDDDNFDEDFGADFDGDLNAALDADFDDDDDDESDDNGSYLSPKTASLFPQS